MPKLSWITDDNLIEAVQSILTTAKNAKIKAVSEFGKNVIDPFSAIFEIAGFNLDYDSWKASEEKRQFQKTLQNFIGEFHQIVLGSCEGWIDKGRGHIIDLVNPDKMIIAEIKNKYNTISGGDLGNLYWSLNSAVMDKTSVYKNYTSYHVAIIPAKSERYNKEFVPSDKKQGQKCPPNKFIRTIDGASFYELVTGESKALENLYYVLPDVISEITSIELHDRDKLKAIFKMAYG